MTRVLALIPTDLERTGLDSPSRLGDQLAGRSVLAQTIARVHEAGVDTIVAASAFFSADDRPAMIRTLRGPND